MLLKNNIIHNYCTEMFSGNFSFNNVSFLLFSVSNDYINTTQVPSEKLVLAIFSGLMQQLVFFSNYRVFFLNKIQVCLLIFQLSLLISPYSLTGKQVLFLTVTIRTRNTRQSSRMNFFIKDEKEKNEKLYTLVTNVFRILKHSAYVLPVWLHDQ